MELLLVRAWNKCVFYASCIKKPSNSERTTPCHGSWIQAVGTCTYVLLHRTCHGNIVVS
jgi:hypothetical protein